MSGLVPHLPQSSAKAPARGTLDGADKRSPSWARRLGDCFRPRAELTAASRWTLSLLGVGLFFGAWLIATEGGLIQPFFLPSPIAVLARLVAMITQEGFLIDIWASTFRVMSGFFLAAALAIPVGVLVGNFAAFRALIEPLLSTARYLPASAFVPLMIIWLGINEEQKISVIFIGTFFPLALLIADISASVSKDMLNSAYTLGASSRQLFFRVLIPACIPAIVDALRVTVGIAWTYVIVAELVGADRGMGIAILQAQRFLLTDQVIAGIVCVGILGVLTDFAFRFAHRKLFPYMY